MIRYVLPLAALAACVPDLDDTTSLVTAPRLLAASNEPAEAKPGASVALSALWASPDGTLADAPLDWAFCTARKELSDPGSIATACLAAEGDDLVPLGTGITATGALPSDGCRRFGPDRPDPVPGESEARPTDPDGTGGYQQPVRIGAPDALSLTAVRIQCGLPYATPEQATQFSMEYAPNENPAIDALAVTPAVQAGTTVSLALSWRETESYLWFDPERRRLTTRREAMRVSWFVSGGAVPIAHTGREEDDQQTSSETEWVAPAEPGTYFVWAVLRDDRGGTAWSTATVDVTP